MPKYTTIMEGLQNVQKYNSIYQGYDEEGGTVDDDGISSHNCDGGVDTKDGEISGLYL